MHVHTNTHAHAHAHAHVASQRETAAYRWADLGRGGLEGRRLEKLADRRGLLRLQVEGVRPERKQPRDQRVVALPQPVGPARQQEVPAEVDPSGQHALRPRGVGNEVRVRAVAVAVYCLGLADVLAGRVGRVHFRADIRWDALGGADLPEQRPERGTGGGIDERRVVYRRAAAEVRRRTAVVKPPLHKEGGR